MVADLNTGDVLERLRILYETLNDIVLSPEADWKTKIYANAALAYFTNPNDVIPESELGEEGYLDDFYICLLILRDLFKFRENLTKEIFKKHIGEEIAPFLSTNIEFCEEVLGGKSELIKDVVGYESLARIDIGNLNVDEKIANNLDLNSKMVGAIAFLYYELIRNKNPCADLIKLQISKSEIFSDINRVTIAFKNSSATSIVINERKRNSMLFINYEKKLGSIDVETGHEKLINLALPLFKTLCNIQNSRDCDWITKHEINCALAYFGVIEDVIPDSIKGGIGFIDDIFLGSFILYDIIERDQKLVSSNLAKGLEIDNIFRSLEASSEIVGDQIGEIINLLGLKGLLSYFDLYLREGKNCPVNAIKSKLKGTLIYLLEFSLEPGITIDKRLSFDEMLKLICQNLDTEEEKKLNNFIELSLKLSYNKNVESELEAREDEEMRLILLRHKIING